MVGTKEKWKKAYKSTIEVMQDYDYTPSPTEKEGLKNFLEWLYNQKWEANYSKYDMERLVAIVFDLSYYAYPFYKRFEVYDVVENPIIPCLTGEQHDLLRENDVREWICQKGLDFEFQTLEEAKNELIKIIDYEVDYIRDLGADRSFPILDRVFGSFPEWETETGYFEIRRIWGVNTFMLVYSPPIYLQEGIYDYLQDFEEKEEGEGGE